MRKLLLWMALAVVVIAGAWVVLPERFAVNAPMLNSLFGVAAAPPSERAWLERVRVPEGFQISVYAEGIQNARMLRFTPAGDLLVSQPRRGRIVLLERDADADGRPDGVHDLVTDLKRPHGLDLLGEWLYIAETDAVGRIRFDPATRQVSGAFERVVTGLPAGGNHWTRTLRFGPDGWMYVSVGSSCNACEEEDERRAALLRFRPDGSQPEIHARGLRNTVGFDWRPETDELFGTDNGRDLLGDDVPPCELNRIVAGGFYGWPYAYGDRQPDPEFGASHPDRVRESLAPAHGFGAHTAPLGIAFLRGAHWPPSYRGAALVALHGSWNRTQKQGYEVVSLRFGERGTITERKFLSGLEVDDDVIGRPVDVAEGPDGAIYVSDDLTGRIYRVTLAGVDTARGAATPPPAAAAAPLAGIPAEEREARAARGAALYSKHFCAQCHEGLRAEEGVIVVPLANLASRYTVSDLMAFLAAPTPPMPALELSDEERRDLAVHLLGAHP